MFPCQSQLLSHASFAFYTDGLVREIQHATVSLHQLP